MEKIQAFKDQSNSNTRVIASTVKKEKDEYLGGSEEMASAESKLIEMNYNKEEKEDVVYGNSQH